MTPQILGTLAQKVQPAHTALVLVDMCNDFLDPRGKTATRGGRSLEHGRRVIPAMRRLLTAARAAGLLVVHAQHTTLPEHASDSGPWLDARSRATFSVTDLCVQGSWGQRIIDELTPEGDDVVVQKYRYSAFAGTNLDLLLRSAGTRTVICAGVSTNVCVEATAREAFSADYYVVLPEDACGSWSVPLHEATLETARHRYATVCTTDDLTALWRDA
ncbi:cysteine hydrolase [Dactylosporangium maewongense]|uniref:Cysteine hydrolase n=1 Tax=Dactylosporangium maewongense TaxID=634393 RepID=A0ABN1ZPZ9_9ACTN